MDVRYPAPTINDNNKFFWYKERNVRSGDVGPAEAVKVQVAWVFTTAKKSIICNEEKANALSVVFSYQGSLTFYTVMLDGSILPATRDTVGPVEQMWGPKLEEPEF